MKLPIIAVSSETYDVSENQLFLTFINKNFTVIFLVEKIIKVKALQIALI